MRFDVLVAGAGAYVRGAAPDDPGTVLPALLGLQREGRIGTIRVAATRPASVALCRERLRGLEALLGHRADVEFFPDGDRPCETAYLEAARRAPAPAAAIVVVPDPLHHRVTADLLDRGLHCLVVKPLAPGVAEARDLAERARARGLLGAVEFHKRFDEANRLLRREIGRGRLGEICSVLVEYSQRRSVPLETFRSWAHQTHSFQYLAVHYVDLIHFVTGALPRRAVAAGRKGFLARQGIDTYDAVHAIVEWRDPRGAGFHSVFDTSWIDPEGTTAVSNQILKVIGTRGRFDSDQKRRGVELVTCEGAEEPNPYFSQLLPTADGLRLEGYGARSIEQFASDVSARLEGGPVRSSAATFDEAVVSTAVCEAVTRSLDRRGAWVAVDTEGASSVPGARSAPPRRSVGAPSAPRP